MVRIDRNKELATNIGLAAYDYAAEICNTDTYIKTLGIDTAGKAGADSSIGTITSMISNGQNAAPPILYPTPGNLTNTSTQVYAVKILQANRLFLQQETTAWIAANYNVSTISYYSSVKVQRDIGIIIDGVTAPLVVIVVA